MTDRVLAFGYRRHPEGLRAVWGARLIAPNDLLWDRQDVVALDEGGKAELVEWLNGEPRGKGALSKALEGLAGMRDSLRETDEEFVVYEDERGRVVGNTQASYGYVYIAGWLHAHETERTASGRVLGHEDFEALADEAERGYDVKP